MPKNSNKGEIIIYKAKEGPELEIKLHNDSIWLTQAQIGLLFAVDRSVVTKHLGNIFKTGELKEKSNVQKLHIANSDKPVKFYSLDAIISVGYRVNSVQATQFRIWATKVLKDHLIRGYAINEKRLLNQVGQLKELQETIAFLQGKSDHQLLKGQSQEILNLLAGYSKSLDLLEQYDKDKLTIPRGRKAKFTLSYEDSLGVINKIKTELIKKKQASRLFGQELSHRLEGIVGNLYQTFNGKELYQSIEEKAAHLLYLIIKDHPFVDGNKRIGSFLFVYFLDKNNHLFSKSNEKKINNSALVALALLIAVSDPKEKDAMIRIITNILK